MSECPPSSSDFESAPDAYSVKLDSFEGPLDLLIHLIKKHEVNIYDIPIALITQQYLEYIEMMTELNLDTVGEFLVMAATLIHIKSKMLLPRPESADDGEPEEDPREALVRRLLEHQKFKAAAELLHERVRREYWGYAMQERHSPEELIAEKYRGIRPAPGYPACPDHTEKGPLFELLGAPEAGLALTESFAMLPAASVCGFYFSHPHSHYFAVGKIGEDQAEDYARRKALDPEQTRRWLAPVLA